MFSLCAILLSQVVCPAHSSCLGLFGISPLFLNLGSAPGSTCVPSPCAEPWELSQGSKLWQSEGSPCSFPMSQVSDTILHCLFFVALMSSVLKTTQLQICLFLDCFLPEGKSDNRYSSLFRSVIPHSLALYCVSVKRPFIIQLARIYNHEVK